MPTNIEPPMMSAALERSLGEAVDKMLNGEFSRVHGELSERERVLLLALNTKAKRLGYTDDNNVYGRFSKHFIELSVPKDRKRAKELVEILKELQQFNRISFTQKLRDMLTGAR